MKNEAVIGPVTVAGQPTDGELRALRSQGYSTVINVRMPGELDEPEQRKVEAAGLRYVEIPYTIQTVTEDDVRAVRFAIESAPPGTKVLTHWAGGTRVAVAVAIIEAEKAGKGADQAVRLAEGAGFDVAGTPYEAFIRRYFSDTH